MVMAGMPGNGKFGLALIMIPGFGFYFSIFGGRVGSISDVCGQIELYLVIAGDCLEAGKRYSNWER